MKRVYPSGSTKRKTVSERQKELNKLPKLSSYFSAPTSKTSTDDLPTKAPLEQQSSGVNVADGRETATVSTPTLIEDYQSRKTTEISTASSSVSVGQQEQLSQLEISVGHTEINPSDESAKCSTLSDPYFWKQNDDAGRTYWTKHGPNTCQNRNVDFSASVRTYQSRSKIKTRILNKSLFQRHLQNGEVISREWLLYSPKQGAVYCFACRLFSAANSVFATNGYSDWKHAGERIKEHECSIEHRKCMLTYYHRHKETGRVDTELVKQFQFERQYWQEVLKRVVVQFLASRGLPFRGENETLGSQQNGNYLGTMELLSQYDSFLSDHLKKYGNMGKGNPSYLSSNICEEFIELMGNKLLSEIISELKQAKYFSISVDSTPDISHVDQLTFTVRYVKGMNAVERFLQFIPISDHTAAGLTDTVLSFLNKHGINFSDCRGQSYDNAANMAGCYGGLQALLKQSNNLAVYVPCAGHSLNLVGNNAASCCFHATSFFQFVQRLYVFFAASTHRWAILKASVGAAKVVKRLSDTRWSAHADAVKALCDGYAQIQQALCELAVESKQKAETRLEANSLAKVMDKFETVFLIYMWNDFLTRFNEVSKTLQKVDISLSTTVKLFQSLKCYMDNMRNQFTVYEGKAKEKLPDTDYRDSSTRVRKRSRRVTFFEGSAAESDLTGSDKFRVETFLPIIDTTIAEHTRREQAYKEIESTFAFMDNLVNTTNDDLKRHCKILADTYFNDLEKDELESECIQFKHYIMENANTNLPIKSSLQCTCIAC